MSTSINNNINNVDNDHKQFLPNPITQTTTTENSLNVQSTFERFTAKPSTLLQALPSPPSILPNAPSQLATEIKRPSSVVNGVPATITTIMAPMNSSPNPSAQYNEQMEAARTRILARVTEKYPSKPIDFLNRKVQKQMATMFPESIINGSGLLGSNTPNTSTPTPLPPDFADRKPLPQRFSNENISVADSSVETTAMDLDDDEDRSLYGRKPKPNSTNESTPRESSSMQDIPYASRSAVQLPATSTNGAGVNGSAGEVDMDVGANAQDLPPTRRHSPSVMEKIRERGICMGYYRLSDVPNEEDKHAVYGKIDKGGDLFTTVSKFTRSGLPVPSHQYLASKCQCSSEKIAFEQHLVGLNKAQLKEYVVRRLAVESIETPESRIASELQIASEVRSDKSLTERGINDAKKHPTVVTGVKRGYSAFADDNDDEDEDDESPLSEINETAFRDTDDEDAFVPSGSSKKRKAGRKSIGARNAKGNEKNTDGDDIRNGVLIGVWNGTPAESPEDKHAVYSYLDARDSLWSRVFHTTKDGRHIDMGIPFPRGTVKWDDIILDDHLVHMDRDEVKEHVRQNRRIQQDSTPVGDLIKKERKSRKSYSEFPIKQEHATSALRSKGHAILLGRWKLSLAADDADKNAVYGYVDTSGRFNLQVRKHTRDGRDLVENNPVFPGNGRVQKDNMILEDHLKELTHSEVQAFTRKAIDEGVAELESQEEKKREELRIVAEILSMRGPIQGEEKAPDVPRVKRKYTRRSIPAPVEVVEESVVDDVSNMRPQSRPQSRMSGMFDAPMGNGGYQGHPMPHPYGAVPNGVPGVSWGPNGSLIFGDVEYHPQPPAQPPTIDETGTIITNKGLSFVQKTTGAFKGKFVHAYRQLISIDGEDYAEYRVLSRTDV